MAFHFMEGFLGRFAPHAHRLLRVIAGLMFAMHGTQKLFGWPGGKETAGAPMMIAAGVIELVCGLLIAGGLLTAWAALVASGEMAVAYFMAHAPQGFWPILNQGELTVLYCFLFLFIAAHAAPARWKRYEPYIYVALRIVAGLMFLMHGTRKLWAWPGTGEPATAALSITAGWIEVITGVLITTGLFTGWAAFLASGTMAVAYWLRHGPNALWPIENRGELAVLYCFLFLYMACRGGRLLRELSQRPAQDR
jgi:putative oxidoreductase